MDLNKSVSALNLTNLNKTMRRLHVQTDLFTEELSVTLYSIIFVLSVTGNVFVILTLIREKKMRTITNMFLLNLAISDMLLSVLCMPFQLVATIVRNFIFGEAMCILIRYFQAVSVGVNCYTLVAISLERYYAICQPLKSRQWQTLAHARRMIIGIWLSVLVLMSPIAAFQRLIPLKFGGHACREIWPEALVDSRLDQVYSVLLAVVLLLIPLFLMTGFYGLMGKKLWISSKQETYNDASHYTSKQRKSWESVTDTKISRNGNSQRDQSETLMLNSTHNQRHVASRKRVVRMLFVIVLQYFICWAPIYTLNTWTSIDFQTVFDIFTPTAKSLILLLAYTSSFIHPITYCFMNRSFRHGFMQLFRCCQRPSQSANATMFSEQSGQT